MPFNAKALGKCSELLISGNFILSSGSGALVKRDCFNQVGVFDEKLKFGEDWDMWIRISEQYSVDFVNEVLVSIRKHSQNMQNQKDEHHLFDFEILKKHYAAHSSATRRAMFNKALKSKTKSLFEQSLAWLKSNGLVQSRFVEFRLVFEAKIYRLLKLIQFKIRS